MSYSKTFKHGAYIALFAFMVVFAASPSVVVQAGVTAASGEPVASGGPAVTLSVSKNAPLSELPFWRSKPELMKKIKNDRAVIVSVRKEDVEKDQIRFTMKGVGQVNAPKEFAFRVAQKYDKLKEVSDHFKTVEWSAEKNELFMITEALGFQARMILKISPVSEDWRSEMQWEIIWGAFQGMKGIVAYEEMPPPLKDKTEVSLQMEYKAKTLPLPKILMGIALEAVTQKIAEKMRSFIETQYKSQTKEAKAI